MSLIWGQFICGAQVQLISNYWLQSEGDNALGNVSPSVCPSVCLRPHSRTILPSAAKSNTYSAWTLFMPGNEHHLVDAASSHTIWISVITSLRCLSVLYSTDNQLRHYPWVTASGIKHAHKRKFGSKFSFPDFSLKFCTGTLCRPGLIL